MGHLPGIHNVMSSLYHGNHTHESSYSCYEGPNIPETEKNISPELTLKHTFEGGSEALSPLSYEHVVDVVCCGKA